MEAEGVDSRRKPVRENFIRFVLVILGLLPALIVAVLLFSSAR